MTFVVNRNAVFANDAGTDLQSLLLKRYANSIVDGPRQMPTLFNSGGTFIDRRAAGDGKSWQWMLRAPVENPVTYTPGEAMLGQKQVFDEVVGTVDEMVRCEHFLGIDQLRESHFDLVAGLGEEHYRVMANIYDGRIYRSLVLAARQAARTKNGLTIHNGGNVVSRTAASVSDAYPLSSLGAQRLREDLRTLYRRLQEDNLDPSGFLAIPTPYAEEVFKYDGAQIFGSPSNIASPAGSTLFSSDYQSGNSLHDARFTKIEGFVFAPSVNTSSNGGPFPNQNFNSGNEENSKFRGTFTPSAGVGEPIIILVGRQQAGAYAVGMLEQFPITPYMFYDDDLLGWKIGAYSKYGINQIHPWRAATIEVRSS